MYALASRTECSADIVILGGGIAGLWLLNHLTAAGYTVLLLESSTLGNGQSIASQGIIHGGLKYALSGSLSGATNAIASMPERWRACLSGDDPVDLTGCRLLSDHYFMWSEGSYRSKLKAFLGSRTLRGKVDLVAESDYPGQLAQARGHGSLYRLPDFVIDTGSLLQTLAEGHEEKIFKIEPESIEFVGNDEHRQLLVNTDAAIVSINAQRFIFAAGEGNAGLLEAANLSSPLMQRRPLNMVMLREAALPRLFVHCIGDSFSLTPRVTLTSHSCENGQVAWYLGGEIAESGVERTDQEQVEAARQMLEKLFPWVDISGAEWACLRVNRAEGKAQGQHRPDSVFLEARNNILVTWPTKFTLSPALADEVSAELSNQGIEPKLKFSREILADSTGAVEVAPPPWERCFERS